MDEIAVVLGGRAAKLPDKACEYALPGGLVSISIVLVPFTQAEFLEARRGWESLAVVKDEPSIGPQAFSFISGMGDRQTFNFLVLKGTQFLLVNVLEIQQRGPMTPPEKLDRLRALVRKMATKI